jgi:hypothetical protein
MTNNIPAWERIGSGEGPAQIAFALVLDGIVQQVMSTNTATASLLLEGPQIIRCKDDAEVGMTAEEAAYSVTP